MNNENELNISAGVDETADFDRLSFIGRMWKWMGLYRDEAGLLLMSWFFYFVATRTQSGWLYWIIAMIGGIVLFSAVQSIFNLRRIEITRNYGDLNPEGMEMSVDLTVTNHSRFPKFMLTVRDGFPVLEEGENPEKVLIPYIPGRGREKVTYRAVPRRRGIFPFGEILIESRGVLGFAYMRRKLKADGDRLTVHPRFERLDRLTLGNASPFFAMEEKTYMFTGKSHDFLGIREYEPGQEIRHIHWPSTAKRGKLMIREFKEIATHSVTVIPETCTGSVYGSGGDTTLEDSLRLCATILSACRKRHFVFNLLYNNPDVSGEPVLERSMSLVRGLCRLAEISSGNACSLEDDIIAMGHRMTAGEHVFVLKALPFEDPGILGKLKRQGVFLNVIFIDPFGYDHGPVPSGFDREDIHEQIRQIADMGIPVSLYRSGEPLKSVFNGRRSSLVGSVL